MSKITINNFCKKAFNKFIECGMTPEGAAGMCGNIYSESAGFFANRVEFLCLQKLRENGIKDKHGRDYTDETYTEEVNSGRITKERFLNPLPGKVYGYSMCQLTTPTRKQGLYERTFEKGKSIADEDIQIEYCIYELKNKYKSVWNILTTTNSIKTASDKVLKDFESPANWQSLSNTRYDYSKQIYDALKNTVGNVSQGDKTNMSTSTKTENINKMIAIAKAEIGYLEKKSNANLDDKTKNAGSNNYTKYWRDVYPAYQGQAWCACFVSWVLMKAFGQSNAKKLLKHWPYVYCPTLGSLFAKNVNPKVGDIVIFYRNGVFAHTGIVTNVSGDKFWTIEGNASGASGITPNGGGVVEKTYLNSQLPGTKFCTPDWSIISNSNTGSSSTPTSKPSNTTSGSTSKLNETEKWKGTVTASSLNVRIWAGISYSTCSFSPLKKDAEIGVCDVVKASDGADWYYIRYKGKTGFASAKYVKEKTSKNPSTLKPNNASEYTKKQFIKDVQKAIGAKVDGDAGSETLSKTVTVSAVKNHSHAVVKPLQKYLYSLGYTSIGTADGDAGSKFTKAVNEYQKKVLKYTTLDGEITAHGKMWKSLLGIK